MTFLVNMFLALATTWCVGLNDPGKNPGTYQDYVLQQLKPDCYYTWGSYQEANLPNPLYNPMLFTVTEKGITQAVRLAKLYPGRTWLIYNEPEGSDQSNTKPEVAAEWFDKAYTQIKEVDSTATIACCGVMVRPEGIDWLDKFVKEAKHKPDIWHIHIYINSQNMNDWLSFWSWFLWWNNKSGDNKPVYVTETCATYQTAQEDILTSLIEYKHPLLKRIYWFSAYPEPIVKDWYCNLLNTEGDVVGVGDVFLNRAKLIPNKLTPIPEPTKPEPTKTPTPTVTPTPTTPKPTLTPIPTVDETTNIPTGVEPVIMYLEYYLPIVSK